MYKDKLFILYSCYLLSLLLYLGLRAPVIYIQLEAYFPHGNYIFNELIQVIVNAFYLQFASVFLKAQTDFPKLFIAIRMVIRLLIGIMVIQFALLISLKYAFLEFYLVNFERFFVIFFTLGAYYYIIKHYKERIILFLLVGSFFFLTGAIFDWIFNDVLFMMMGSAMEVFVFSLGMGYRVKMVAKEKESIENEIVKIQLTALKAQMNPHFIFNSLNSIRAYVISNNVKMASDYLTKFSRLIRLILNYSSKNTISLKDELDALTLYVQLEQLRFRDDFGFVFKMQPCVDSINLHIPPLILQPYVENAIIHGLAPKKGDKKLQIDVSCSDSHVVFKITDNGVGRHFSKKIKRSVTDEYKSMAMELTKKRIDLTETTHSGNENIIVNDLTDGVNPMGTEVILKLPVMLFSTLK